MNLMCKVFRFRDRLPVHRLCENLLLVLGDGLGHGAAKRLCDAFITKGSNVELPVNTPIFLRLNSNDPSVAQAAR